MLGDVEAVRRASNPARSARLGAARADQILPQLPATGRPEGLRGRRDAVSLLPATSGLRWTQIAALTQRDVQVTDTGVTIGANPCWNCPPPASPRPARSQYSDEGRRSRPTHPALADTWRWDRPQPRRPRRPHGTVRNLRRSALSHRVRQRGIAAGYIDELDPLPAETIATTLLDQIDIFPVPPVLGIVAMSIDSDGVYPRISTALTWVAGIVSSYG